MPSRRGKASGVAGRRVYSIEFEQMTQFMLKATDLLLSSWRIPLPPEPEVVVSTLPNSLPNGGDELMEALCL